MKLELSSEKNTITRDGTDGITLISLVFGHRHWNVMIAMPTKEGACRLSLSHCLFVLICFGDPFYVLRWLRRKQSISLEGNGCRYYRN